MSGTNIDRKGGRFSQVSKSAEPQADFSEKAPSALTPVFKKTPFQAAAVAASSALLPSVDVNADAVPNVGALVDRMQPMAWEQLQNVFTSTNSQAPSTETDPLAQEVWVDGEFLKFMATPIQNWAGGKYAVAAQYLQGVKLTGRRRHLDSACISARLLISPFRTKPKLRTFNSMPFTFEDRQGSDLQRHAEDHDLGTRRYRRGSPGSVFHQREDSGHLE